jgi:hypothetical protein
MRLTYQRDQWDHTSALMALLANCHRDAEKTPRAWTQADFHPCGAAASAKEKPIGEIEIGALKVFLS